jgi:hypothetical protein
LSKAGDVSADYLSLQNNFGAMGLKEIRRPMQFADYNCKLKMLVADLILDKVILQDVL